MPEARSFRRSEHTALGKTITSERSSSERREDVVRLAPQPLRLLFPQLGDKRLVDAIEERHLAHRCPRLRTHSPWLIPASERSKLKSQALGSAKIPFDSSSRRWRRSS